MLHKNAMRKAKRRDDKFEELVAAVYEFDHWLSSIKSQDDKAGPQPVSPFAKVQSIFIRLFPAVQRIDW